MREITNFLNDNYVLALKLCKSFDKTKDKKWNAMTYLNELYVQVGHVYNILYKNENIDEPNRNFDNLGDEISDILLQLINLADELNIDMMEISTRENSNIKDTKYLPILMGQLSETIMEENGYRFKKSRFSFSTNQDFIKDRIFQMFFITYNFARENNLDINKEFHLMLDDANNFLINYKGKNKIKKIKNKILKWFKLKISNLKMYIQLRKIYNFSNIENKRLMYNESKILSKCDYKKGNIKYSVVSISSFNNNYMVYLLMIYKNKSLPFLLERKFNDENSRDNYFNELYVYLKENSNKDIINKIFLEKNLKMW